MWLKHLALDGQTYLEFSWGNPRGFESHSFHQFLLAFLWRLRIGTTFEIWKKFIKEKMEMIISSIRTLSGNALIRGEARDATD